MCVDKQAWPPADLERCRHPDLPLDEGAVQHGLAADDRLRRGPLEPGRPRLDRAGDQYAERETSAIVRFAQQSPLKITSPAFRIRDANGRSVFFEQLSYSSNGIGSAGPFGTALLWQNRSILFPQPSAGESCSSSRWTKAVMGRILSQPASCIALTKGVRFSARSSKARGAAIRTCRRTGS